MCCVMLKNFLCEPNSYCRKTGWKDWWGLINIRDLLCSSFTVVWILWCKTVPLWRYVLDFQKVDTWRSLIDHRLFQVYLSNHEESSWLDAFLENMLFCRKLLSSVYEIAQVRYVNTWAYLTPLTSNSLRRCIYYLIQQVPMTALQDGFSTCQATFWCSTWKYYRILSFIVYSW